MLACPVFLALVSITMRIAILCVGLLFAPSLFEEKKPTERAEPQSEKKAAEEKLIPVGVATGVIQSFNDSSRELVVRITFRRLEPNPSGQAEYARHQQQWMQQQAAISRNPNPVQRQQQLMQLSRDAGNLARLKANLFHVKEVTENITVVLTEDAKIRAATPPEEFDEKGNIKRYTQEELQKLRGSDPSVPGFPAGMEILEKNHLVMVKVMRKPGGAGDKEKQVESLLEKKEKKGESMREKKDKPSNGDFVTPLLLVGPEAPKK